MSGVQGVILAAGRGSRLGALGASRPKALVPLCGRPLLEWQLLALRAAGVTDVRVIGGYRAEALTAYAPVVVNDRWQTTNMVCSMLRFENAGKADVVLSYGDIVYSGAGVTALLASTNDIALAYDVNWLPMWAARFASPLQDAESFRAHDGLVVDIGRKVSSAAEIRGQYMGLVKFSARGWADCVEFVRGLPPAIVDRLDMTSLLRRMIDSARPVAAIPYEDAWAEVDSEHDLMLYEKDPRFASLRTMLGGLAPIAG